MRVFPFSTAQDILQLSRRLTAGEGGTKGGACIYGSCNKAMSESGPPTSLLQLHGQVIDCGGRGKRSRDPHATIHCPGVAYMLSQQLFSPYRKS